MITSLRSEHKEHLQLLISHSEKVINDFCKLAEDYIKTGPDHKLYQKVASKLNLTPEEIQNCIYAIVNLSILASKQQLNEEDLRDSLLALGFSIEQQTELNKFHNAQKSQIEDLCKTRIDEPTYHDLQWRFEVQLGTRTLPQQVTPLISMDLILKSQQDSGNIELSHHLLQTDPTNLVHLANEIENALHESRSRYSRRVQKTIKNLQH
ncbi:hypothetical protein ABEB36_002791 [Hypothenemus hampei]|uniref:COMM domain-containing protein n=1 Tax=Hypothenemus hampei TaxID=57062 RepID=A0ABD1F6Y9_HYPHA